MTAVRVSLIEVGGVSKASPLVLLICPSFPLSCLPPPTVLALYTRFEVHTMSTFFFCPCLCLCSPSCQLRLSLSLSPSPPTPPSRPLSLPRPSLFFFLFYCSSASVPLSLFLSHSLSLCHCIPPSLAFFFVFVRWLRWRAFQAHPSTR